MLDDRYKSPWAKLTAPLTATVGELFARAGGNVATIGFAGGSKDAAGVVQVAGSSSPVTAWGATAMAVTRLVKVGSRVFGNIARGAVTGLPRPADALPARPQTARVDISLGSRPNAPAGVVRSGSVTNPFATAGSVFISSSGLARYLTVNGSRVSESYGAYDRVSISRPAGAGETFSYALYSDGLNGWAGGDVSFVFYGPDLPPVPAGDPVLRAQANAGEAIPFLDLMVSVPWFPSAESFARAGTWVRRDSWTDQSRQRRFEEGIGSARAVLIESRGGVRAPVSVPGFVMDDYLADDWRPVGVTGADFLLVDVTDLRFETSGLEGFLFTVTAPTVTPDTPPDTSGVTPTTPQTNADFEEFDGTIMAPAVEIYPLIYQALYRTRIVSFTHALRAGTCTLDLLVDGVSYTANAVIEAGSRLDLQVTAATGAGVLAFTIGLQRE